MTILLHYIGNCTSLFEQALPCGPGTRGIGTLHLIGFRVTSTRRHRTIPVSSTPPTSIPSMPVSYQSLLHPPAWGALALFLATAIPCQADQAAANAALGSILAGERVDILHAEALPDGGAEILFGVEANDLDIRRIADALRAHPDIRSLVVHTSPRTFCRNE